MTSKIQDSGERAFRAGIKYQDCPFAARSLARREWQQGWRVAREKDKEESSQHLNHCAKVLAWWQESA